MKLIKRNPLLLTDVYKMGHMEQYVPGCTKVYSYLQARKANIFKKSVFFGLQYYMDEYLSKPITKDDAIEFLDVKKKITGTESKEVEEQIFKLAKLGYWPIEIKAVEEGSIVPTNNVLMTMTNTNPDFYWTVGFVESLLLKIWYPITVATCSMEYSKIVAKYFMDTVEENLYYLSNFTVHDFGYRGDSSEEGAIISGMAHLTSFNGSDTIPAYNGILNYYGNNHQNTCIMSSIPASEHSVMCSFGRNKEIDAYKHMLKLYPSGLVSIVSDTYNIWNVLTEFAKELKNDILNRDGKVVFRPDSGNPEYIICGDPNEKDLNSPVAKGCLRLLDEIFGSSVNSKGFKQLNPKVGLIYGDGITLDKYNSILTKMKEMGYAASNLVIGVGGLLRNHRGGRDALGFAIKATSVTVNGENMAIMKDPITDPSKKSHKGFMKLKAFGDQYTTIDGLNIDEYNSMFHDDLLTPVFRDGVILKKYSLDTIRDKIKMELYPFLNK